MSFIGFLGGQKFLNTILMMIGKEEDSVPFGPSPSGALITGLLRMTGREGKAHPWKQA